MKPFMSAFNPHCYALMRIVAGFLFLWHGMQKLFGIPSAMPPGVPPFITYVERPSTALSSCSSPARGAASGASMP